jgi:hypothetical protein
MDILERKLAYRLDRNGVLNCHQYTGAYEDLTRLGFVAKPRGDIGHRSDGGIIKASLKAEYAERGKAVRNTDAKAESWPSRRPFCI